MRGFGTCIDVRGVPVGAAEFYELIQDLQARFG